MPLGERLKGRLRYGLDNPFTRNIDPTLVLDIPFSEGVGSITRDRSLYGNHGTIYGASWVDGQIGKALSFDGIDDYVNVPDSLSQRFPNGITVLIWVKANVNNVDMVPIAKVFASTEISFYFTTGEGMYAGLYNVPQLQLYLLDAFTGIVGSWLHYAMTYDNSILKIYRDGVLRNSVNAVGTVANITQPITIGRYFVDGAPTAWNGSIDEVRIYNRALTAQEILNLYNEGK